MIKCVIYNYLPEEAKSIRQKVFVEEQGFNEEFDDVDDKATHVVIFYNDNAVGTGRMFLDNGCYHLGRVAVLREFRKLHIGSEILAALEKEALKTGYKSLFLFSQIRAVGFYKKNGYSEVGNVFLDEGYPHIKMVKMI